MKNYEIAHSINKLRAPEASLQNTREAVVLKLKESDIPFFDFYQ